MRRFLGALLLAAAPMAAADDVAKGLENLTSFLRYAAVLEMQTTGGVWPLNENLDPWGTPYRIDAEAKRIVSAGSDRKFDEASWTRSEQFTGTAGDVVWAGDNFVRTNHNWLCTQVKAGSEAATQLAAFRKLEGEVLMLRSDAARKIMGVQLTRMAMQSLAEIVTDPAKFTPPAEAVDAWGTPLRFVAEGGTFRIVSAGADRTFQPMTWTRPAAAADVAEDIVLESGRFIRESDEEAIMSTADRTVRPLPQPVEPALRDQPNSRFARLDKTITPPVALERVEPEYPEAYRRVRISGIVTLELAIDETGKTSNFAVLKSLGPALDVAALDAARRWTFKPAMRDGQPIPVLFNLTINFKLKD